MSRKLLALRPNQLINERGSALMGNFSGHVRTCRLMILRAWMEKMELTKKMLKEEGCLSFRIKKI